MKVVFMALRTVGSYKMQYCVYNEILDYDARDQDRQQPAAEAGSWQLQQHYTAVGGQHVKQRDLAPAAAAPPAGAC
jgi:hypothetical protein